MHIYVHIYIDKKDEQIDRYMDTKQENMRVYVSTNGAHSNSIQLVMIIDFLHSNFLIIIYN